MMHDLADRPVLLAGAPVELRLRQALDFREDALARGLTLAPERLDLLRKRRRAALLPYTTSSLRETASPKRPITGGGRSR